MSFSVREIFFTLQGEGVNAGRPAVFCRFAGCNLWTGRETDRARAICQFCDTDFVGVNGEGGGKFRSASQLAEAIAAAWPARSEGAKVALTNAAMKARTTGDAADCKTGQGDRLSLDFRSGYSRLTQGRRSPGPIAPVASDPWEPFVVLTGGEPLLQCDESLIAALHEHGFTVAVETNGTQLAPAGLDWICVSPKAGAPLRLTRGDELKLVFPQRGLAPRALEDLDFDHFLLQPMDGPNLEDNLAAAAAYCRDHRPWRLSLQTHKVLGIR